MPEIATHCPYCNALIRHDSTTLQNVVCSLCGEQVKIVQQSDNIPSHQIATNPSRPIGSHRIRVVLITMSVLVIFSSFVFYIIIAKPFASSKRHLAVQESESASETNQSSPLRFLPVDTDAVININLKEYKNESLKLQDLLNFFNIPGQQLDIINQMTIVEFDKIDSMVLAMKLSEGSILTRPMLIIHSRTGLSLADWATRAAAREVEISGQNVYTFRPSKRLPIELYCFSPSNHVAIITLDRTSISSIQSDPPSELALKGSMRLKIEEIPQGALAWAVIESDHWEQIFEELSLLAWRTKKNPFPTDFARELRSLSVILQRDQEIHVQLRLEFRSEPACRRWHQEFGQSVGDQVRIEAMDRNRVGLRFTLSGNLNSFEVLRQALFQKQKQP